MQSRHFLLRGGKHTVHLKILRAGYKLWPVGAKSDTPGLLWIPNQCKSKIRKLEIDTHTHTHTVPVTVTHNSFCSSFCICKPAADERQKPLHLHSCDPCSGKHALRHNNALPEHRHHQHCSQADTLAAAADSELGLNSFLRCFAYCYSLRHPGQREREREKKP